MNTPTTNDLGPGWTVILSDLARLSVLRGLYQLKSATTAELSDVCHTSDSTVRRHLKALEALGLVGEEPVERNGVTPGRPPTRFVLAADAAAHLCALFELLSEPLVPTPGLPSPPPRVR